MLSFFDAVIEDGPGDARGCGNSGLIILFDDEAAPRALFAFLLHMTTLGAGYCTADGGRRTRDSGGRFL